MIDYFLSNRIVTVCKNPKEINILKEINSRRKTVTEGNSLCEFFFPEWKKRLDDIRQKKSKLKKKKRFKMFCALFFSSIPSPYFLLISMFLLGIEARAYTVSPTI